MTNYALSSRPVRLCSSVFALGLFLLPPSYLTASIPKSAKSAKFKPENLAHIGLTLIGGFNAIAIYKDERGSVFISKDGKWIFSQEKSKIGEEVSYFERGKPVLIVKYDRLGKVRTRQYWGVNRSGAAIYYIDTAGVGCWDTIIIPVDSLMYLCVKHEWIRAVKRKGNYYTSPAQGGRRIRFKNQQWQLE